MILIVQVIENYDKLNNSIIMEYYSRNIISNIEQIYKNYYYHFVLQLELF